MAFVDVTDLDDMYSRVPTEDILVPDGVYLCEIVMAEIQWIQTKPPARVFRWKFQIVDGDYTSAVVEKVAFLREDLIKWLKIDLAKLDIHFGRLSEVQQHQSDLLGIQVEIKLVTKEDRKGVSRQNCWINKMIKNEPEPAPYKSPPKEDDIPF